MDNKSKRSKLKCDEVTETKRKKRKGTSKNAMEGQGPSFNMNNLPDDILWIIFNYLSIRERTIFGCVCTKWRDISRRPDPDFWRNVVVSIKAHRTLPMGVRTMALIQMLPQCVSSLKLYYDPGFNFCGLEFSVFSLTLLKMCPNLEELIIIEADFTDTENIREINLSNAFSKKLKVLKLREIKTKTEDIKLIFSDSFESDIEVFDISHSWFKIDPPFLKQMPRLRELYLAGIHLERKYFDNILSVMEKLHILDLQNLGIPKRCLRHILEKVSNNCSNLTELYVCFNKLRDRDVIFLKDTNVLPQLQVICLRGCAVTFTEINSLIDSRQSLQTVYVGLKRGKPECNYARCNSIKVKHRLYANFDDDCEHDESCKDFRNEI